MKILAIIPAKLDSNRLKKKNIQKIKDKTLVEYSVDYALASTKYEIDIIVSSESLDVRDVIHRSYKNVRFHHRDISLCGDVEVVDVYIHIVQSLESKYDLVIGLQPDNPNRSHTIDECIDYMINNSYDDLISINSNYKRSGSIRIFKYDYLRSQQVSKRIGCIQDSAVDIHYQEDLEFLKTQLK